MPYAIVVVQFDKVFQQLVFRPNKSDQMEHSFGTSGASQASRLASVVIDKKNCIEFTVKFQVKFVETYFLIRT